MQNDNTLLSLQIGHYEEHLQINDHQTWQNGFKGLGIRYPEISEVGLDKIRGSKPRIAGTIMVPSWTNDEVGLVITSNAWTRGVNPSMACGACPFLKSDDSGSVGDSMISSITTKKGGQGVSVDIRPNLSLTQLI